VRVARMRISETLCALKHGEYLVAVEHVLDVSSFSVDSISMSHASSRNVACVPFSLEQK